MKPNFLDRLIGEWNPRAGAERLAWRAEMEMRMHYDAADSGRLQSRWIATNEIAELTDAFDRDIVRARARDLERNSDIQNSVIRAFRRNVVGTGIHVRVTVQDHKIAEQIEAIWKMWCKAKNCDVTGTQSFSEILRMCIQRKVVDGGYIILKRYTNHGIIPFQLQVLEVDDLDTGAISPKYKGNRVIGGVELNSYNRPVGYWLKQYTLDGYGIQDSKFFEAKDVIFKFSKKRPTQVREMSDMSPAITRVKDANEFMNAVTVKEKIAACFAAFIKRQNPAVPSSFSSRNAQGTRPQDITYAGKRIVPGMIMELNVGDEPVFANPNGAAADASGFTKQLQRMISSGQGLSYEATSRDMSDTTYSSARQSLIEDDLTYAEERELLEAVMDEIYETFVISCWLAQKFNAPDFWQKKEVYFQHEWVVEPRRWIDPQKEAGANRTALQSGQKTFQQTCSEYGRDWKKVIDEMAEAIQYADGKGIDLSSIIYDPKSTGSELNEKGAANGKAGNTDQNADT